MKVYVHYKKFNDVEYRWRTLLQIGDSWEICGTIIMKNPGSSFTKREDQLPIEENGLLENLRKFDNSELSMSSPWYEFFEDNTMTCVKKLFDVYYSKHQKQLRGVIQIFNLFNIRDADIGKAINKSKGDIIKDLAFTVDDDINSIVPPIYVGWGDLWKAHRHNAEKFFSVVREKTSYLCKDIENNKYYHPQYLMIYGKNNINCQIALAQFLNDINDTKELDSINHLFNLKRRINPNGTINKITADNTLTYEYFCKRKNGKHQRRNGTISVGLMIEDNKYILSALSLGNHPDMFKKLIRDFCISKGWTLSDDNMNYSTSVMADENTIIAFMTSLLKEMKKYRETDIRQD